MNLGVRRKPIKDLEINILEAMAYVKGRVSQSTFHRWAKFNLVPHVVYKGRVYFAKSIIDRVIQFRKEYGNNWPLYLNFTPEELVAAGFTPEHFKQDAQQVEVQSSHDAETVPLIPGEIVEFPHEGNQKPILSKLIDISKECLKRGEHQTFTEVATLAVGLM